MSGKTKIVVLKLKELICAGIFAALAILAVILLIITSGSGNDSDTNEPTDTSALYVPGTYTTAMVLNGSNVELAVTVDETAILSIELQNMDETVSVMYPLMEPALENIAEQICSSQSLDNITYPEENQYTSIVILDAIHRAVDKARTGGPEGNEPAVEEMEATE